MSSQKKQPRQEASPFRESVRAALSELEPERLELLTLWEHHLAAESFASFRQSVLDKWPAWQYSPTAQLLVGLSHFHEKEPGLAEDHVAAAEGIWKNLALGGALERRSFEVVRSSLACCRAKILLSQGHQSRARLVLQAGIDSIRSCGEFSGAERDELSARLEQFLADGAMHKLLRETITSAALP